MSNTETPAWASKYLDDVETRTKRLETPPHKADASKTAENEFIKVMQEINSETSADQAGGEDTNEDDFINEMKNINLEK